MWTCIERVIVAREGQFNKSLSEIRRNLYLCWLGHNKISLRIRRTNIAKHMITSTVAHVTIPPRFWVLSACKFIHPNMTLTKDVWERVNIHIYILRERGREDLLQLFKTLLDCCGNILDVVVYSINNSALFGDINSISKHMFLRKLKELILLVQEWICSSRPGQWQGPKDPS